MDEQIRRLIADNARLSVDPVALADDDDLYRRGMTSVAAVSLMIGLEDEFALEFPQEMLVRDTFQSIASIRDALAQLGAPVA
jgi:acyl carrier protein